MFLALSNFSWTVSTTFVDDSLKVPVFLSYPGFSKMNLSITSFVEGPRCTGDPSAFTYSFYTIMITRSGPFGGEKEPAEGFYEFLA